MLFFKTRKLLLCVSLFLILLTTFCFAKAKLDWEIDIESVFKKSEGSVSNEYTPIIIGSKIILASEQGLIKSIDIKTKKISYIARVPISIHKAIAYPPNNVIFYGQHKRTNKSYYCAVNISKKKFNGFLEQKGPLWKFDDWAFFEKDDTFYVFDPKKGKNVYAQKANTGMQFPIRTQDDRNVFFNDDYQLVELGLPKTGTGLLMASYDRGKIVKMQKSLILFEEVADLALDIIPDTLNKSTLYYHKKNGTIGRTNIKKGSLVWEKNYFKKDMQLIGQHVYKNQLFYIVSYRKGRDDLANLGKVIALNRKTGLATWLSPDLYFKNFAPVQFRKYIISGDLDNNILLLDMKTGAVKQTIQIEGIPSIPVVNSKSLYILTTHKLYKFDSTNKLPIIF